MTHFEYIAVLVSLELAIGIGHLFAAFARLLQAGDRVRFDPVHLAATGLLVLLLTQFWWGFWNFRLVETWSYLAVLSVLAPVGCLVVAGLVLVPADARSDAAPGERIDLGEYYFAQRGRVYGLAATTFVLFTVGDALILHQPLLHPENLARGLAIVACIVAMRSGSRRTHQILLGLYYALLVGFLLVANES